MEAKTMWLVGRFTDEDASARWAVGGIFTERAAAESMCRDADPAFGAWFVMPVPLDTRLPFENEEAPCCWYPAREPAPEAQLIEEGWLA